MNFSYHMPTKLIMGEMNEHINEFKGYGKRALIVTGRSSAKNGSLDDVKACLNSIGVVYALTEPIPENPAVEDVDAGADLCRSEGCDFIVAIGGGSAMDCAKGIALLASNPGLRCMDLFTADNLPHLPMLAVPTTAGTGSETTPFSVLTLHEQKTKNSIKPWVFFEKAFLNGRYMMDMPDDITLSTAVDALCHLVEGYLSAKSNYFSDTIAEGGFVKFAECLDAMDRRCFDLDIRNKLLMLSSIAGIVITQAKTSLPHQLGYALTYNKNIPHGYATGILLTEYMRLCMKNTHEPEQAHKVGRVLELLGITSIDAFEVLMKKVVTVKELSVSAQEISAYAERFYQNKAKHGVHPAPITLDDIEAIYRNSLG